MERKEIGSFSAITFSNLEYEFIVYDDNTMDCPTLNINNIKLIELKPRFVLSSDDLYYVYDADPAIKYADTNDLIGYYDIEDELFMYLKVNHMIRYSNDMAYLYDFIDKKGYDNNQYGVGSPYKWAKKKGPILSKQRRGIFN